MCEMRMRNDLPVLTNANSYVQTTEVRHLLCEYVSVVLFDFFLNNYGFIFGTQDMRM